MRARTRGFSLIEMLTVVTILGIMAMIAFPSFTYLTNSTRVKSAATTIFLAMLKARSEAVRLNGPVTITPTAGDFAKGWTMTDNSGNVLQNQEALNGVRVISSITTQMAYLSSGRLRDSLVPTFSVVQAKTGSTVATARCISVSPNGSPYMKQSAC